jgi:hypothetical protein
VGGLWVQSASNLSLLLKISDMLMPLRCEEGRPKTVRNKVAGKGQQHNYWTEAVQVTNTDDTRDLSSEGAPDIDKTANVKQKLISGREPQMGLDTKTDWPTRNVTWLWTCQSLKCRNHSPPSLFYSGFVPQANLCHFLLSVVFSRNSCL